MTHSTVSAPAEKRRRSSRPPGQYVSTIVFALVMAGSAASEAQTPTILLDDFESGSIRVVNPDWTTPEGRLLWNQYEQDFSEGPDPGVESISTATAHDGAASLRVNVTGGNLYLQFYPYDGFWRNMRQFTEPAEAWQMDTFNRMRFWIKVPQSIQAAPAGQANGYMGTYVRSSSGSLSSAEAGGNHYYHSFNIPYTGQWHQIIFDTHPNHVRGANGGTEAGDQPYPTGERGYNYFDALTRFYIDFVGRLRSVPADFYLDGFELYRENRPENIRQIYTLNAVYIPPANKLRVAWMRHKDENSIKHEVRYAFEDVFALGWENAEPAPDGLITPPGWQGYNGMEWETDQIDLTGQSVIYIAIKPENSSLFRQIAIPLTAGAMPRPADPPPSDTTAPGVSAVTPTGGATDVAVNASVTARFTEAMDGASVTAATFDVRGPSGLIAGSVGYDNATLAATFAPAGGLRSSTTYTATVHGSSGGVTDLAGNPLPADRVWSFTTAAPADTTPPTITSLVPGSGASSVATSTSASAKFSEALDPTSVTSATVDLRGPSGLVASTVSYDAATWTATARPTAVLANGTTYTATIKGGTGGVRDPAGNVLAGTYSWSFTTSAAAPTVVSVSPGRGATGVTTSAVVTAQFSKSMAAASISGASFQLRSSSGAVSAAVAYDEGSRTATLRPSTALSYSTTYTATVKGGSTGVKDLAGNAPASDYAWSFSTAAAPAPAPPPPSASTVTIFGTRTPGGIDADTNAVELGVRFHSHVDGQIVGIRFYKYAQNIGTHRGNLWAADGRHLATVTFSKETASGWQEARFSTPVPIKANVSYIASYHTSVGRYAVNEYFFSGKNATNGPLEASADGDEGGRNGVYKYGSTSRFPNETYRASNYWVDVIFVAK